MDNKVTQDKIIKIKIIEKATGLYSVQTSSLWELALRGAGGQWVSWCPSTAGSCLGTFCLDRSGENCRGRVRRSRAESTTRTGYWSIRTKTRGRIDIKKKKKRFSVPELQACRNKSTLNRHICQRPNLAPSTVAWITEPGVYLLRIELQTNRGDDSKMNTAYVYVKVMTIGCIIKRTQTVWKKLLWNS